MTRGAERAPFVISGRFLSAGLARPRRASAPPPSHELHRCVESRDRRCTKRDNVCAKRRESSHDYRLTITLLQHLRNAQRRSDRDPQRYGEITCELKGNGSVGRNSSSYPARTSVDAGQVVSGQDVIQLLDIDPYGMRDRGHIVDRQ